MAVLHDLMKAIGDGDIEEVEFIIESLADPKIARSFASDFKACTPQQQLRIERNAIGPNSPLTKEGFRNILELGRRS